MLNITTIRKENKMDKVRLDELTRQNDNAQWLKDINRLDEIISKGGYISTNDLFDQDDLLGE